jgi:acetyl coenzyme A synthetase (ADP forming)-like protein
METRPRFFPPPYQDAPESGRLILRDGQTAQLRLARPEDRQGLQEFFASLSPESRRRRFFSANLPTDDLLAAMADSANPKQSLTLLAWRTRQDKPGIIAVGSYFATERNTAEVAFAVAEEFQGKGLGTLLLERLAVLAARNGFTRFCAMTHPENRAMREVFRESGFEVREAGTLDVDFSIVPTERSVERFELHDRIATIASLRPFFHPNAVAVVGASRNPGSVGHRILTALLQNGFQGPVYPVNPKTTSIGNVPACPSVRALPEQVDLAVIAVPRESVLSVVDECADRGVRALVVITAGFAEVGADGRELQKQLLDKVRGRGLRMIGPNCLGLVNADPAVRLNASFSPVFPPAGRVALSSQSGALGLAILTAASRLDLGLSTFVSVGNKADVSGNDLLQYWEEDPNTDVILLYLESFGNPRRFARIAPRVGRRKPIVALKAGRTQAGGRAAGSHTAALAASDVAVDALFHQTGVIRAETLQEMFDLAALLGNQPLPGGRRVAIITNAGGPGILCADACEAGGLNLPPLSAATKARLAEFLPPAASLANPVDLIASASPMQYQRAIQTLLASGETDALVVIYIPAGLAQTEAIVGAVREGLRQGREQGGKHIPVAACWMTDEVVRQVEPEAERLPVYSFPEAAARALAKAARYAEWKAQPPGLVSDFDNADLPSVQSTCRRALETTGPGWLSAGETRAVLSAMSLPLVLGRVAATSEEAVTAAEQLGFPVAVKLASRQLVHKTEVGGVYLNLPDAAAVRQACTDIREQLAAGGRLDAWEGVLVQPMVTSGAEVMVGVTQDPLFGPLIGFGLGGIHVEILGDVCFRGTPLTDRDAGEMIRSIRGFRLLQGYRGHPAADLDALQDVLLRVSWLVEDVPEIHELDLNPIFALPPGQGCQIADARIFVRPVSSNR